MHYIETLLRLFLPSLLLRGCHCILTLFDSLLCSSPSALLRHLTSDCTSVYTCFFPCQCLISPLFDRVCARSFRFGFGCNDLTSVPKLLTYIMSTLGRLLFSHSHDFLSYFPEFEHKNSSQERLNLNPNTNWISREYVS